MKRIFYSLLCLIFGAIFIVPNVFYCKKYLKTAVAETETIESRFENKVDLISSNPGSYTNAELEQKTPFDELKKQSMEGFCITPTADTYGQVQSATFSMGEAQVSEEQSFFVWIYLPETSIFATFYLTLSVSDNFSNTCSWTFNNSDILSIGGGWRLFELKLSDANTTLTGEGERYNKTYTSFRIIYKSSLEDYQNMTSDRMSFYHLFLADSYSNETSNVVFYLRNSYFKFKSTFFKSRNVLIGDSYVFESPAEIFEYVYLDKQMLTNFNLMEGYSWEISMLSPSGVTYQLDFGDTFDFDFDGYYTFQIKIIKAATSLMSKKEMMSSEISVYSSAISLGGFITGSSYKLDVGDTVVLTFEVSENIEIVGGITITLSNNNANLESYYEKDGVYYIKISGQSKGSCVLTMQAQAKSVNNSTVKTFTKTASFNVKETSSSIDDVFYIILWVTFSIFSCIFIVLLIKSLVKARSNDVK